MTEPDGLGATDPLRALVARGGGALAVVAGTEGPSYRPLGAMMALMPDGTRVGSLSSGCVEADIALQAAGARTPVTVRYGRGSAYADIRLPCGGAMEVLILPAPDLKIVSEALDLLSDRLSCGIEIDIATGRMRPTGATTTARRGDRLRLALDPELRFLTLGAGPEALAFAALAHSAGYPNMLLSPDEATRCAAAAKGIPAGPLTGPGLPPDLAPDARTAIALFFHDHDREPGILQAVLASPAFYIGAQGSLRAHGARLAALRDLGVAEADLARIHSPAGLVPSARDPRTLAVSVLAEALAAARPA